MIQDLAPFRFERLRTLESSVAEKSTQIGKASRSGVWATVSFQGRFPDFRRHDFEECCASGVLVAVPEQFPGDSYVSISRPPAARRPGRVDWFGASLVRSRHVPRPRVNKCVAAERERARRFCAPMLGGRQ